MQTYDVRKEFQGSYGLRIPAVRYLCVHHAAALYRQQTGIEDVRAVHRYHLSKGWGGIGYSIVGAEEVNGGPIARYILSDPLIQRAHVWGRNHEAIGVSCLTNFTGVPEDKWIDFLAITLADLKRQHPQAQIVGHTDIALPGHGTACPGPAWPLWRPRLLDRVSALLKADGAPQEPAQAVTGPTQRLTSPPGAIDEHLPILGPPHITQAQALAYLLRQRPGHYTRHDLERTILPGYWRWCAETGVSFGIAIAQMIHETGRLQSHWSQRPQRNPAGIGVTGRSQKGPAGVPPPDPKDGTSWAYNTQRHQWETGLVFASWNEAIPAHVLRLLGYAKTDMELTAAHQALLLSHTARRPLPAAARGSARTLRELGARHNRANQGPDGQTLPREKWKAGWAWDGALYGHMIAVVLNAIRKEAT